MPAVYPFAAPRQRASGILIRCTSRRTAARDSRWHRDRDTYHEAMALQIYMVGLVAGDVDKSLEFYRRLGVDFPEGSEGQPHVEVKMNGELTFFVNARGRVPELDDCSVVLEFYLKERGSVDAKYAELTGLGYVGRRAPFVASIGMRFAVIDDPDGNAILLSGDL